MSLLLSYQNPYKVHHLFVLGLGKSGFIRFSSFQTLDSKNSKFEFTHTSIVLLFILSLFNVRNDLIIDFMSSSYSDSDLNKI